MNTRFFVLNILYFTAHLYHGLSTNSMNKIVGGTYVDIRSIPYALSFMLNDKYACCAFIINCHWAATAAHCVAAAEYYEDISLRSGSSFLYKGGMVHNVIYAIIHENYSDTTNDYDIAVMKVNPPFIFGASTRPVYLPQSNTEDVDTECGMVCGWGYFMKIDGLVDSILSKQLQCTILPLINKTQCNDDYNVMFKITPRMTCYGFQNGTTDSCKGDSGSALVNKDNILIGITSWGVGCGKLNSPGVYTDAVILQDWIRDKTGECTWSLIPSYNWWYTWYTWSCVCYNT